MTDQELVQEGRNQVLYLLICIGDENVAHDHWHPDRAHFLYETRREIVRRLEFRDREIPEGRRWPKKWPDFGTYIYTPG